MDSKQIDVVRSSWQIVSYVSYGKSLQKYKKSAYVCALTICKKKYINEKLLGRIDSYDRIYNVQFFIRNNLTNLHGGVHLTMAKKQTAHE